VLGLGRGVFADFGRGAGEQFERLVDENDGQRELQDGDPFGGVEGTNLKDDVEEVHVEDHKVKGHGEADSQDQVNVFPRRHADHRLILRHAVQRVEHFDDDQHGERHRHRFGVAEDRFAVDAFENGVVAFVAIEMMGQLVIGELGSGLGDHVPPSGRPDGGSSDVQADDHVTEKEPGRDERFLRRPRLLFHDVQVGRVEAQRGGRQTVGDQVDPQQLDGNQRFR